MNVSEFSRSMIVSFLASMAVTIILWFFLYTLHIDYVTYLAPLIGMYVFVGFGVNRMVDEGTIENDASGFVLAVLCVIVYSIAFLYIMPIVFGPNVFPAPLNLANYGIGLDMAFTNEIILAIFAVIVLAISYLNKSR